MSVADVACRSRLAWTEQKGDRRPHCGPGSQGPGKTRRRRIQDDMVSAVRERAAQPPVSHGRRCADPEATPRTQQHLSEISALGGYMQYSCEFAGSQILFTNITLLAASSWVGLGARVRPTHRSERQETHFFA